MYNSCNHVRHSSTYCSEINWSDKRARQLGNPGRRCLSFCDLFWIPTDNRTQTVNIFVTATFIFGLQHGLGQHQVISSFSVSEYLLTVGKARVDADDPHPPNNTIITLKVCNVSAFWTSVKVAQIRCLYLMLLSLGGMDHVYFPGSRTAI